MVKNDCKCGKKKSLAHDECLECAISRLITPYSSRRKLIESYKMLEQMILRDEFEDANPDLYAIK